MLSHVTSSLVGTACVIHAAAEVTSMADSSLTAQKPPSAPAAHDEHKPRRLLQKFKERRQRTANRFDVGILAAERAPPRRLDAEYDYYCPRETCPAELCDCADSGGSLEDCTEELRGVCRSDGGLDGCVFHEYLRVYEEVYCPFVSCVGEGFHENQCDCAFYELYCNRLEGEECTPFVKADVSETDKKPFFGCDKTEMEGICEEAKSCTQKGDLQGLPSLGTWKGAVQTGMKAKSGAGENIGTSVVAAATLLSAIWCLM